MPRRRLGLILPSSNSVVEPLAADMLHGRSVSAHVARIRVHDVALDDASRAQFALERYGQAVEQLADARVEAIVWGGTSASWLGVDHDQNFCDAAQEQAGISTTTCVLAINRLLEDLGSARLGLVTPYTEDVHERIITNYAALGFRCVDSVHLGGSISRDFADVAPDAIADGVRRVAQSRPDVVVIMCTNLRGAAVAAALTAELDIPVVDSAAATITAGLELLDPLD